MQDSKSGLPVYSTCPSEHVEQLNTDLNYQLSTTSVRLKLEMEFNES